MILFALVWVVAACFPLTDADIWWHLASGRAMVQHGHWLLNEPFSYAAQGQAWTNVHWLYQLWIYGIHYVGGAWGSGFLVALHALAWGLTAWIWARVYPQASRAWLWGLLPLMLSARFLLLARPLVFTLLLLGLQRWVLETRGAWRWRWGLLLGCQVLLANVQGLFLLGPGLFFLLGWAKRVSARRLWGGTALLFAVSMINPVGVKLLLYPLRLFGRLLPGNAFAHRVSENVSPLTALLHPFAETWTGAAATWQALGLLTFTVLWLGVMVSQRTHYQSERFRLACALIPLVGLAWLAERNIPLLYVVGIPWLAATFPTLRWEGRAPWVGSVILVACCIGQGQWWYANPVAEAPFRFPSAAADYLQKNVAGSHVAKVFAELRHAGYFSWRLYPQVRTFADGRLILRDESFFLRYLHYPAQSNMFFADLERDQVDWVVLPVAYPPGWDGLARRMGQDPRWSLQYVDECAWVFARADSKRPYLRVDDSAIRDSVVAAFDKRSSAWPEYQRQEGKRWLGRALFL